MTAPLSRIQYIRQVENRPVKVPVTGRNPYADEWGILPDAEIRRLLAKHSVPSSRGRTSPKTRFMRSEIGRMAECRQDSFLAYCRGENSLSRTALRSLCRLLKQMDDGWIVKIDGWPVMLYEPRRPPPEVRFHVGLSTDSRGKLRTTVVMGSQLSAAVKTMPRLFADFSPGKRR